MTDGARAPLKILHVLRAPVGGLFRHVIDLARGQAARGHRVGLIADSAGGGAQADAAFADLASTGALALGLSRIPMCRDAGLADVPAVRHVTHRAAESAADVLHGHGAKGGAYARLARSNGAIRVYTPHGGSLHYRWSTPAGLAYLAAEWALMRRTDLFLFESEFGREVFRAKVGTPRALVRVVHNGVTAREFEPVAPDPQAADLVFVGELRRLKGVDVLIGAMARLAREGLPITATIAGDGPDRSEFETLLAAENIADRVRLIGATPARRAFALGRLLVVPSRAESLPYVVLEAAAGGLPLIASNVGGIPEIFGPDSADLVPADDPAALARAMAQALRDPEHARAVASRLRARVQSSFSADAMTEGVLDAYEAVRRQRHG